jgi:hypothetical protein
MVALVNRQQTNCRTLLDNCGNTTPGNISSSVDDIRHIMRVKSDCYDEMKINDDNYVGTFMLRSLKQFEQGIWHHS